MLDLSELKSFDMNGYNAYFIPDHHLACGVGIVYEHMLIAEEMLGRELNIGEVVHHEDRNRKNNSPSNLKVFKTRADHSAYHAGRDIVIDGDVYIALPNKHFICPVCGNRKDWKADMCKNCRDKEKSKHIPSKEEISNLLLNNSMCVIGRMYGVSDNAVRKWCKKYNLPFNKKDIELFKNSQQY